MLFRCSSSLLGGVLLRGGKAGAGFWKGTTTTTNNISVYNFCKRSISDDQVREGMEEWIQKYVIDHQLCPFAAKNRSNHRIAVYSGTEKDLGFELAGILMEECERLVEDKREGRISSSFVVFPNVEEYKDFRAFDITTFNIFLMGSGDNELKFLQNHPDYPYLGAEENALKYLRYHPDYQRPGHEYLQGLEEKIGRALPNDVEEVIKIAEKYALEIEDETNDIKYLPFQSPWPALQLFLKEDFEAARATDKGQKIQLINEIRLGQSILSGQDTVEQLDRIRRTCARPLIRLSREPTPEQRAALEKDGYRFEVIDVDKKDGAKK